MPVSHGPTPLPCSGENDRSAENGTQMLSASMETNLSELPEALPSHPIDVHEWFHLCRFGNLPWRAEDCRLELRCNIGRGKGAWWQENPQSRWKSWRKRL